MRTFDWLSPDVLTYFSSYIGDDVSGQEDENYAYYSTTSEIVRICKLTLSIKHQKCEGVAKLFHLLYRFVRQRSNLVSNNLIDRLKDKYSTTNVSVEYMGVMLKYCIDDSYILFNPIDMFILTTSWDGIELNGFWSAISWIKNHYTTGTLSGLSMKQRQLVDLVCRFSPQVHFGPSSYDGIEFRLRHLHSIELQRVFICKQTQEISVLQGDGKEFVSVIERARSRVFSKFSKRTC